jgi:uroporphyrinogen III methyltransferase/synthase
MSAPPPPKPGTVYLVGAGPGNPDLLTLRAVQCLAAADIVLYDYLVNPAVLDHVAAGVERVALGRPGTGRALTPDEITDRMITEALRGRTVTRLKGGDPSVFGRGADETAALRAAGIPFEIVPGITAGLAAAAYCEVPLTQQDDASALALVAGRERNDKTESHLDYGALAAFPGTLVFYMGVGRAPEWSAALIEHGRDPETPVAIVRWVSRADQTTVRCTLGSIAEVIEDHGIRPPALCIVGAVVERAPVTSWFSSRPLFGIRVLVPGSPLSSEKLHARLSALGAEVILAPTIRIAEPPDWTPVDAAIDALASYDWLVFSSPNGVDRFLGRLYERGGDARRLGNARLAAIGTGTAERLERWSLRADLVPEEFIAESLARSLVADARDRTFLVVRASRGRNVLADALTQAGGVVDPVVAYTSEDVDERDADVRAALEAGAIDWVTITSGSTARSLVRLYGDSLKETRFASIGPIASAALRELGFEPTVEAAPHTTAALVEAMLRAGNADD